MENMDDSFFKHDSQHRDAIMRYCELTPCAVSKKKRDTKEVKGNSMVYLYTAVC